jgi:2-dehydro-3-deoxyphosphogalactonate aldolase
MGFDGLRAVRAVLPAATQMFAVRGCAPESFANWRAAAATGFGIGTGVFKPGFTAIEVSARARTHVAAFDEAFA